MKKILVVGSLNMDLVVRVQNLPKLGETILGDAFYENPGGKGANQAVAAARLGAHVSMIGKIGKDAYGSALLENLGKNDIDTDGIIISDVITGRAVIEVDSMGNNNIVVIPGSNMELTKEDIDEKKEIMEKADIVILQQEIPISTVEYVLEQAKKSGKITILNPAPAQKIEDNILKLVDYLILNETELELITGSETIKDEEYPNIINDLQKRGSKNIILTLGEKGGIYTEENEINAYKALKVKAVDTTAAGDSFIGAFALKLAEGRKIEEAVNFAVAVSALTVTKIGAQQSLPTKVEINEFLEKI